MSWKLKRSYWSGLTQEERDAVANESRRTVEMYATENLSLDFSDISMIDDETNPEIQEFLLGNNPSDLLVVSNDLYNRLDDVIEQIKWGDRLGCPSDLIDFGILPMEDVVIRIMFDNLPEEPFEYRVVHKDGQGYLVYTDRTMAPVEGFVLPLVKVNNMTNVLAVDPKRIFTAKGSHERRMLERMLVDPYGDVMVQHIYGSMDICLKLWYAFEICLLNPAVKPALTRKYGKEKLGGKCMTAKKNGRKTLYVRRLQPVGDIFSAVSNGKAGIQRKTLCWYVIGHYRTYSNGKRVFVKPYWKGPLRETMRNQDEGRIREI